MIVDSYFIKAVSVKVSNIFLNVVYIPCNFITSIILIIIIILIIFTLPTVWVEA